MLNNLQQFSRSTARHVLRPALRIAIFLVPLGLYGCGNGPALTVTNDPGPSPFIAMVHLTGNDLRSMTAVQYTIAAKPGTVSSPVQVEYSLAALQTRGYVSGETVTVPVYGLYAGYDNQVQMEIMRQGQEAVQFEVDITTENYLDPTGIYSEPNVIVKRAAGSSLGYSFIYVKSAIASPVILDTDGNIRWVLPDVPDSLSSAFTGDTFVIGSTTKPIVYQAGLDGKFFSTNLPTTPSDYIDFGHDITAGKVGLLGEPDALTGNVEDIESNVMEMSVGDTVAILNNWDLGAIISNYMTSQGDDAAAFVRPGVDWFHLNSAIYDPSDDSLIVSSRENFIIKLDYSTGTIKWILGDPTKYWYTFPSLRAKALTLSAGGFIPSGSMLCRSLPTGCSWCSMTVWEAPMNRRVSPLGRRERIAPSRHTRSMRQQ